METAALLTLVCMKLQKVAQFVLGTLAGRVLDLGYQGKSGNVSTTCYRIYFSNEDNKRNDGNKLLMGFIPFNKCLFSNSVTW